MNIKVDDSGSQSFDPLSLGLVKPESMDEKLLQTVTRPGGVPLGEGDSSVKGGGVTKSPETAIQDILEEIKASDANLPPELLGVAIGFNLQSARLLIQHQIDNLDPANPALPVLLHFVELTQKLELSVGDLISALGSLGAQTVATQKRVAAGDVSSDAGIQGKIATLSAATTASTGPANVSVGATQLTGNAWLAGNSYTVFMDNFTKMMRALKEMKVVDGETQIIGMNMMVELAKDISESIMNAAEERFWKHIAMAIVDAVSIVVTVACTVGSMVATLKMKPEVDTPANQVTGAPKTTAQQVHVYNMRWQATAMGFDAASRASTSAEKSMNNILEGVLELKAAHYDALKEMLQTYRQMAQMQADRSLDMFKQNGELLAQLIQLLDQLRSKIMEAQQKALSRG